LAEAFCLPLEWFILIVALGFAISRAVASPNVTSNPLTYLYPQDDLGAVYRPQSTILKVWAPTARNINVAVYADATTPTYSLTPMACDTNGVWSATLDGNCDGKYYLYQIELPGSNGGAPSVQWVDDPYAHGSSANSTRTLIFDPIKTNPTNWDQDQFVRLDHNTDAILYEVHVRDFTISPNSGIIARGKFLGMTEAGTKTPEGEASGLNHLAELGITHVHLLPVNDYASGDERQPAHSYTWYDWGYDPVLFATPEGSYASEPDGTARVKELKSLVQAFHQRHLGVVMDVVFNHTASAGFRTFSIFDKIFPNATGCGNEFASERPMARKFIVDTIKYWMTEYHVDGFRFDLMGILDRDTMLEVLREARKINPGAIIYGEGWDMEHVLPADKMMTQANVQSTGLAAFNDGIRDNIKGDAGNGTARGFVQGGGAPYGGPAQFWLNIKGQSTGRGSPGTTVASPNESINYDSVHDDLCLWDKLQSSAPDASEDLRISMDELAAGIVLTAQGVPFLHAGDEFLRSKNGVSNSYNSNDPHVNPIDWSLKAKHKDVFNYYQGLISLRKAHPAFRLTDKAAVDQALEFATNSPENVVAYLIRNNANGDAWKNILVVYNGTGEGHDLTVTGDWTIIANDQRAGVESLGKAKDQIHIAPFSMIVAHSDGNCRF
jgi:pullulanase